MPTPTFDFDVTAQPAMPPPPPAQPRAETPGVVKSTDPRHNPGRGDQR
jgi:hypothetical protein